MRPEYGCPRGEPLHHELTAGTVTSVPRSSEPPPSLPPPMHTHWGPAGQCWGTPQSVVGTQPSPPLGPRWQTVPSGGDSGAQQRRRWPEPPSQSAQDVWFMRSVSAWFRTSLLLANRTERWGGPLCPRHTRVHRGPSAIFLHDASLWGPSLGHSVEIPESERLQEGRGRARVWTLLPSLRTPDVTGGAEPSCHQLGKRPREARPC